MYRLKEMIKISIHCENEKGKQYTVNFQETSILGCGRLLTMYKPKKGYEVYGIDIKRLPILV